MGAALTTVDAVLKNFYIGPLQKQINDEVAVLEMFEKAVVTWSGKKCVIAVHTQRNTGTFVLADGGTFKAAGNQTVKELDVRAKYMYGRFEVTGPTIASAKGGNARSFIGALNLEMGELVKDVRNLADRLSVVGHEIKGYICEKVISDTPTDDTDVGDITTFGRDTFIYDGDFTVFSEVIQGTIATWVRIEPRRMDTYDICTTETVAGNLTPVTTPVWFVSAADAGAGTIDIEFGHSNAGLATGVWRTDDVQVDRSVAIRLLRTQAVDASAAADIGTFGGKVAFTEPIDPNLEQTGIFTNLSSPTHFTIDRTTAGAGETALQTHLAVQNSTVPGGRQDMTLPRLGRVSDEVYLASGEYPDCLMISPLQRNKYQQLLQGHITKDASAAPKADGGFRVGDMAYGDVPIKSFRQVPNGIVIFLKKASWLVAELQKGEFADMDGRALSRVANKDAYEGYYAWYWELVCQKPFCNAVLCGLTITT